MGRADGATRTAPPPWKRSLYTYIRLYRNTKFPEEHRGTASDSLCLGHLIVCASRVKEEGAGGQATCQWGRGALACEEGNENNKREHRVLDGKYQTEEKVHGVQRDHGAVLEEDAVENPGLGRSRDGGGGLQPEENEGHGVEELDGAGREALREAERRAQTGCLGGVPKHRLLVGSVAQKDIRAVVRRDTAKSIMAAQRMMEGGRRRGSCSTPHQDKHV